MLPRYLLLAAACSAASLNELIRLNLDSFRQVLPLPPSVLDIISEYRALGVIPKAMPTLHWSLSRWLLKKYDTELPLGELIPVQNVDGLRSLSWMREFEGRWTFVYNEIHIVTSRPTCAPLIVMPFLKQRRAQPCSPFGYTDDGDHVFDCRVKIQITDFKASNQRFPAVYLYMPPDTRCTFRLGYFKRYVSPFGGPPRSRQIPIFEGLNQLNRIQPLLKVRAAGIVEIEPNAHFPPLEITRQRGDRHVYATNRPITIQSGTRFPLFRRNSFESSPGIRPRSIRRLIHGVTISSNSVECIPQLERKKDGRQLFSLRAQTEVEYYFDAQITLDRRLSKPNVYVDLPAGDDCQYRLETFTRTVITDRRRRDLPNTIAW